MVQDKTVNVEDLEFVLKRLRDVRAWHVKRKGEPWAFRQALIIVMELDTIAALERGVKAEVLASFDAAVRKDSRAWVRRIS